MSGWFQRIRASWYLVIGAALLYVGVTGASDTVSQIRSFIGQTSGNEAYLSDQGFVPYSEPIGKNAGSAPDLGHSRMKPTGLPAPEGIKAGKDALVKLTPTPAGWVETPVPQLVPVNAGENPDVVNIPQPTFTPLPSPTPEPTVVPEIPTRIMIASIGLDADVVPSESKKVTINGAQFEQWLAPDKRAAGWQTDSALLGQIGNTVLNGHHNINGLVFQYLVDVKEGDTIVVYGSTEEFRYVVTNKMILPEKYVSLDQRMENARWIMRSDDERLTLVTCWPFESNTHRLIIVAEPIDHQPIGN